ncbi:MAG: hypothetical protein ABIG20_02965 [archaeon]
MNYDRYNWIKYLILRRMLRDHIWDGAYRPLQKFLGSIKGHEKGFALEILNDLIKEGILLSHKGSACISLSTQKKREIEEFIVWMKNE